MSEFDRLLGGFSATRAAVSNANDPGNLFRDATWDQIGTNKELTDFLKSAIDPDGSKYGGDVEALKTDILNTTTMHGANTALSVLKLAKSLTEDTQKKQFENLIGRLYESAPNRLLSGNVGETAEALGYGLAGGVLDPANLLFGAGFGSKVLKAVGFAGKTAAQIGEKVLARDATKEAIEAVGTQGAQAAAEAAAKDVGRSAVIESAKEGALREIPGAAATGFLGDLAEQEANVQRGLQDEVYQTQSLANVAGGALLGGAFGGAGGAMAGRALAKELRSDLPNAIPSGRRDLDERISDDLAGEAGLKQLVAPKIVTSLGDEFEALRPMFYKLNGDMRDAGQEVAEFGRDVVSGNGKSKYTPEQIDAIRDALVRLQNSDQLAEAHLTLAARLEKAATPDSVMQANAELAKAANLQRFASYATSKDYGAGEIINATGDIDDRLVALLRRYDDELAVALAPPPPAKAKGAGGAGAAAAAGTPPTAPAGGSGGAGSAAPVVQVPAQPAAPGTPAGDAAQAVQDAATGKPTAAAPDAGRADLSAPPTASDITAATAKFSDEEKAALAYLNEQLGKANLDLEQAILAMQKSGLAETTKNVATAASAQRGQVQDAMQKVTAAIQRERSASAAPVQAPVQAAAVSPPASPASPEVTGSPGEPAVAPAAVAPVTEERAAARVDATQDSFDQLVALTANGYTTVRMAVDVQIKNAQAVVEQIAKDIEDAVATAKAAVTDGGQEVAVTKEQKLAIAQKTLEKFTMKDGARVSDYADVFDQIDPNWLVTSKGRAKVAVKLQALADDAVSFTYAKAIGDILPDVLNVTDFDTVLRSLTGLPGEAADKIVASYRSMVQNALAERATAVGIERVRKEFGAAWDNMVAGTGGFQPFGGNSKVKVDIGEIVNGYTSRLLEGIFGKGGNNPLGDLTKQMKQVGGMLRDYMRSLNESGIPMDSQFMSEALHIRGERAVQDVIEDVFRQKNKVDFDKMDAMRALRESDGRTFARTNNNLRNPFFGGIVENPILHRVWDEETDLVDKIVSGRRQPRNGIGVRQATSTPQGMLSDGISDYLGFLWANPRNLFSSAGQARRAIYGAGVEAASWARGSMMIAGQKVSGSMKEVKGLFAEIVQGRLMQQRFGNVMEARQRLAEGAITEQQYRDRLNHVGQSSGIPVQDYEEAVAQRFIESADRIQTAKAMGRAEAKELLEKAGIDGALPAEQLGKLSQRIMAVVVKHQANLIGAAKDYEAKAVKVVSGKALKGEGKETGAAATLVRDQERLAEVEKKAAVEADREGSPVIIKVAGESYEMVPNVAVSKMANGDLLLFGRKIGTWRTGASKTKPLEVTVDGLGTYEVADLQSLIKPKSFRNHFAEQIKANAKAMTKAAPTAAAVVPDGSTVPVEMSNTATVQAAKTELQGGKLAESDLDKALSTFEVPEGRVIAFKRTANGRVEKLGVKADESAGMTIRQVLDRLRLKSVDDIQVGSVPAGKIKKDGEFANKTSQDWLVAQFRGIGTDTGAPSPEVVRKLAAEKPEVAPLLVQAQRRPITIAEAGEIDVGNGRTLAAVINDFDAAVLNLKWSSIESLDQLNVLVARMKQAAAAVDGFAPHGVRRDNASRRTTFSNLERIIGSVDPKDRAAALDLLRRVDTDGTGLPYIYQAADGAGGSEFAAGANRINLNAAGQTGFPVHVELAHEVAHWAFHNVLSASERIQFIESLGKYANADGSINPANAIKGLANLAAVEKLLGRKVANVGSDTNELFAWHFTNWYMDRAVGKAGLADELPLWQRVVKYTKAILSKFLGQPVDKDMEKLFERIMPTTPADKKYDYSKLYDQSIGQERTMADIANDEKRKSVGSVLGIMENIDTRRQKLATMLFSPGGVGDSGFADELKGAAKYVFGLLYGKERPYTVRRLRGVLNPMRDETGEDKWVRDANGKVMKGPDGKGLVKSYRLPGSVDPRELFSGSGAGKLMTAITDVFPEDARGTDLANNIAFEAASGSEEFAVVMKAAGIGDNPEVQMYYNQVLAREFEARMKAGVKEVDALDAAEIAATKEAADYAHTEFGIDINSTMFDDAGRVKVSSSQELQVLGDVARKLYDLMTDAMEHLEGQVSDFGFTIKRNPVAMPAAADAQDAAIIKEVAKATKGRKPRKPKVAATTEQSAAVAATEAAARGVDGKETGVPTGAPDLVKAIIARVPHRDPEQQDIIETMLYRLINHVMPEEMAEQVTNADIARLAGVELEQGVQPSYLASTNTAAFDSVRKTLRAASEHLTNPDRNPIDAAESVGDMLINAGPSDGTGFRSPTAELRAAVRRLLKGDSLDDKNYGYLEDYAVIDEALEVVANVEQVLSGLGKTARAKSVIGDVEVVAEAAGPIAARHADGRFHPKFAKDDIRRILSGQPQSVVRGMLDVLGISVPDGGNMARALADSLVFAPLKKIGRNFWISADEAVEQANGVKYTEQMKALDNRIGAARAEGDGNLMASLMAQRDVLTKPFRLEGATSYVNVGPMFIGANRIFDPASINQSELMNVVGAAMKVSEDFAKNVELQQAIAEASGQSVLRAYEMLFKNLSGYKNGVHKKMLVQAGYQGELRNGALVEVFDGVPIYTFDKLIELGRQRANTNALGAGQLSDTPLGDITLNLAFGEAVDPLAVEQRAITSGAPGPIAKIAAKLHKKNRSANGLTDDEFQEVRSFHGLQLAENSVRIARAGGQWLANQIKPQEGTGFFESLYTRMSADLMPVVRNIDSLVGINNGLKKAFDEIKRNLSSHTNGVPQSEIEDRLVSAMRRNNLGGLSKQERAAAMDVQQLMQRLLKMQRDAGIDVGDVTRGDGFYLPQRFNVNYLIANRDESIRKLARWFVKDSGDSVELSTERARKVIDHAINNEELKGIIDGASSTYAQAFGDRLYQRKLNIAGADWIDMTPLFDNNLKSLVISYTEAAHKRVEWSSRFGIKGHAVNTYTNIASEGSNAAIRALMNTASEIATVADEDVQFAGNLFSPLTKNPEEARQIVNVIVQRLAQDGKKDGVRNGLVQYLTSMYENNVAKGEGQNIHFAKHAEAIVNGLADFGYLGGTVAKTEREFMLQMTGTLGGRPAYTINANQGLRTAARGVRTFNSVTLLAGTVLASLPDLSLSLMRSGSMQSWLKGTAKNLAASSKDPAYAAAMARVGVGMESILAENIAGVSGGLSGRVGNAFFWANGLTPWTNAMRQSAAMVGYESIKANQAILKRELAAGATDSRAYLRSVRYLRQLGLAYLKDAAELPDFAKATEDARVAQAIHKFVNESVFQPNRNDMPLWTQDPIAGMFWQFKSYPMMMGRLVKRTITEAFAKEDGKWVGDPSGLMYLLTVGAAAGAGTMYAKDVLYGKNQEADANNPGGDWRSPRERSLSKIAQGMGLIEKDGTLPVGEDLDAAIGWFAEGMLNLGALGFLGDLLYQSAKSIDNGAFGRERITSQILGPSYGTFSDALQVIEGGVSALTSEEGDPNGKARNAARKVLKRIPGVGQQDPLVEGWVTWLAGESQTN